MLLFLRRWCNDRIPGNFKCPHDLSHPDSRATVTPHSSAVLYAQKSTQLPCSATTSGPEHTRADASLCGLGVMTESRRPPDLAKYPKTTLLSMQEEGDIFLPHTCCAIFKLHLLSLLISDYTGSQLGITFLLKARGMINEISVCGTDGAWYFCHRAADLDSCNPYFCPRM